MSIFIIIPFRVRINMTVDHTCFLIACCDEGEADKEIFRRTQLCICVRKYIYRCIFYLLGKPKNLGVALRHAIF